MVGRLGKAGYTIISGPKLTPFSNVSIVDFEQVNVSWEVTYYLLIKAVKFVFHSNTQLFLSAKVVQFLSGRFV